jgi:hypothetical protein
MGPVRGVARAQLNDGCRGGVNAGDRPTIRLADAGTKGINGECFCGP